MDLSEEVSYKIANDSRWEKIPYDYAYISIALNLTVSQALQGFKNRKGPEQVMFEEEGFTEEQIKEWQTM